MQSATDHTELYAESRHTLYFPIVVDANPVYTLTQAALPYSYANSLYLL